MNKKISKFLKIKIEINENFNIGPGKISLLESIISNGSISSAAKEMGMSYRKAWKLIKEINDFSSTKIVITNTGGKGAGGAKISDKGLLFIKAFRNIERKSFKAAINEKKYLYELFKKK